MGLVKRTTSFMSAAAFGFPGRRSSIIAVSGTIGKSSTAAYLASILQAEGKKVAVRTSSFTQIGHKKLPNTDNAIPYSSFKTQKFLFKARLKRANIVILEVEAGQLDKNLGKKGHLKGAIVTNITGDGVGKFGKLENYVKAQNKLLSRDIASIALNRDDKNFDVLNKYHALEHKITFGYDKEAESRISSVKTTKTGSTFVLTVDQSMKFKLKTSVPGGFNVSNAAAAASLAYVMHIKRQSIVEGIEAVTEIPGRMESINKHGDYDVIIDSVKSPIAMEDTLKEIKKLSTSRLILVLAGGEQKALRGALGVVASQTADRIVLTDGEPTSDNHDKVRSEVMRGIKRAKGESKTHEVVGREGGIRKALDIARKGDTVVIVGMGQREYDNYGENTTDKLLASKLIDEKRARQQVKKK